MYCIVLNLSYVILVSNTLNNLYIIDNFNFEYRDFLYLRSI